MVIGEVKSIFAHQGVLNVTSVTCDEKIYIGLAQAAGASHFSFSIDPEQVEHFVDMLRLAKRSAGEDLAQARS